MTAYPLEVLAVPCPTCKAVEGDKCRNPITNTVAHIACVARLKAVA
jgi:hypothetical protein